MITDKAIIKDLTSRENTGQLVSLFHRLVLLILDRAENGDVIQYNEDGEVITCLQNSVVFILFCHANIQAYSRL